MRNLIGQILDGKYSIEKELGKGGMGAVYFAVHTGTKRPVAVKVIVPQFMQRTDFIQRFRREAEAAGRLRHPNVVNVTDFGFAETAGGKVAYLVMEYLDGCTLGEILEEENRLPVSWTIDILEQVCAAVQEAHRQGIIHRDLKPDNIWLEPNPRGGYTAKVLDFGIAKLETPSGNFNLKEIQPSAVLDAPTKTHPPIDDGKATKIMPQENVRTEIFAEKQKTGYETVSNIDIESIPMPSISPKLPSQIETLVDDNVVKTEPVKVVTNKEKFHEKTTAEITRVGAIMGTPLYMSPEQCRGERLGTSSDIYSLGVIAYQMLSGKTPFEGESISIITGHLQFPPPPLISGRVPRKVKNVIQNALSKEPIKRPPTAEIFAAQLRSYSENIWRIFRRALVIFTENFSKLIWFSLLLYFPTIFLAVLTFLMTILESNQIIPANIASVTQVLLKTVNLSAGIIGETLITGAVAWIVVRYIDTPLQSFRIIDAFQAILRKWKDFAWILPIRIVINFLIQGDLTAFNPVIMLVLTFLDSILFWSVPCVVVMENYQGLEIFKRSWRLNLKVLPTIIAAALINTVTYSVISTAVSVVVANIVSYYLITFQPAENFTVEKLLALSMGPALVLVKLVGTVLLPFFAVVTALIYLKSRHAKGESMKVLLDEFKQTNLQKRNWQKKIRARLEESKQIVRSVITK